MFLNQIYNLIVNYKIKIEFPSLIVVTGQSSSEHKSINIEFHLFLFFFKKYLLLKKKITT
jgi:hypothetical protein